MNNKFITSSKSILHTTMCDGTILVSETKEDLDRQYDEWFKSKCNMIYKKLWDNGNVILNKDFNPVYDIDNGPGVYFKFKSLDKNDLELLNEYYGIVMPTSPPLNVWLKRKHDKSYYGKVYNLINYDGIVKELLQCNRAVREITKNINSQINGHENNDSCNNDVEPEYEYKSNAQEILNKLCHYFLGEGYYIGGSVGGNQANEIIYDEIISKYNGYVSKIHLRQRVLGRIQDKLNDHHTDIKKEE